MPSEYVCIIEDPVQTCALCDNTEYAQLQISIHDGNLCKKCLVEMNNDITDIVANSHGVETSLKK